MDIQKGKKKEKEKEGLNEDRTRGLRMTGLQSYALPLSYQSAVLVTPAENSRRIDHSSSPLSSSRPVSIIAFLTLDEKTEQLAKKVLRMVYYSSAVIAHFRLDASPVMTVFWNSSHNVILTFASLYNLQS